MSYDFNADEIFQVAEQLERNGASFYSQAAAKATDADAKTLLNELAAMERDHQKVFAGLRAQLTAAQKTPTVFDPNGESERYLQALADTRVFFEKKLDVSSMETVLKDAITAEKDSIVFYLGMKDIVPPSLGKDRIEAIIKEEMGHISLLSRKLAALKK